MININDKILDRCNNFQMKCILSMESYPTLVKARRSAMDIYGMNLFNIIGLKIKSK